MSSGMQINGGGGSFSGVNATNWNSSGNIAARSVAGNNGGNNVLGGYHAANLSRQNGGNPNAFAQNGDQPATINDLLELREKDKADQKEAQRDKEMQDLQQIVKMLAANQGKTEKKSGGPPDPLGQILFGKNMITGEGDGGGILGGLFG